jgi:hypothetical protein
VFRLAGGGLIGFLLIALWIYCIFDVIATEEMLMRSLNKVVWLMIVIFLPDIGSIAWLALGRPAYAGWRPGDTAGRPTKRVSGPEDRADFGSGPPQDKARLEAWEADLKRRELEMRRQERKDDPEQPPFTW